MTTRVTEGARRERPCNESTLSRACTPLTKSEEKERLFAVYRSRNIIHESAKIFAFSSIKTQHKLYLIYDKPNLKEGKIYLKDNKSEI